jgi:large subunit ribosomal protein L22
MQVRAKASGLKISPRKIGVVASLVRGRSVNDAKVILDHTPRLGARMLKKVIISAESNAENNHKTEKHDLYIDQILVGNGTILKRFRAGSRGSVRPIKHRSSNVTVIVQKSESNQSVKKEKNGS